MERECVRLWPAVKIASLPPVEWQKMESPKGTWYRMVVEGKRYGASWSGRIDLHARHAYAVGDVVRVREFRIRYEDKRERYYLVLDDAQGSPTCELVWATAETKTTLKGFGLQYWAEVGGSPLARWDVRGGYRSGRAYTVGVLAVVDACHPLIIRGTGDIEYELIFPKEAQEEEL